MPNESAADAAYRIALQRLRSDRAARATPSQIAGTAVWMWTQPVVFALSWYARFVAIWIVWRLGLWALAASHADDIRSFADVREMLRLAVFGAFPTEIAFLVGWAVLLALGVGWHRPRGWWHEVLDLRAGLQSIRARRLAPRTPRPLHHVLAYAVAVVVCSAVAAFCTLAVASGVLAVLGIDASRRPGSWILTALYVYLLAPIALAIAWFTRAWTHPIDDDGPDAEASLASRAAARYYGSRLDAAEPRGAPDANAASGR